MPTIGMDQRSKFAPMQQHPFEGAKECATPYCITLRSRTDTKITGWYDGSDGRSSTDHNRQKVFDKKCDARSVCHELRSLYPRNAEVINIEAEQDDPALDVVPPMF